MVRQIRPYPIKFPAYQIVTENLIKLLKYNFRKMKKNYYYLTQISNNHPDIVVQKEVKSFLVTQKKLIKITTELLNRMERFALFPTYQSAKKAEEMTEHFLTEVDIVNYANFEISKSYFVFIHKNFEVPIIPLYSKKTK